MLKYFALILMSVLAATGQVLITKKAREISFSGDFRQILKNVLNFHFIIGGTLILIAPILYFFALTSIKLNVAYAVYSLNYIFILFGSYVFLKEKITRQHIYGILIIIFGLVMITQ